MTIWKNSLALALISAFFGAVYQAMDNITLHNFVKIESDFVASLSYLSYGAWNSFFVACLMTPFFGRRFIDPDYRGLSFGTRNMRRDAMFAGIGISISSCGYIGASRIADPSIVCALSSLVIIYTALIDTFRKQIRWQAMFIPALLAVTGGTLAAYSGQWKITFLSFFLIVIVSNVPWSFVEFAEQRGAKEVDSVNFFLWRGLFLALGATVISVTIATCTDQVDLLIMGWKSLFPYELWIAATMILVWFSVGLKITGKKITSVSAIMIIVSSEIVIAYPITLIGNAVSPNLFGKIPSDTATWILRLFGAGLIITSIILVPKKNEVNQEKIT